MKEDLQVVQDLFDALMARRESRVGMATNMIGVCKRIIAFLDENGRTPTYTMMIIPIALKMTVLMTPMKDVYRFSASPQV